MDQLGEAFVNGADLEASQDAVEAITSQQKVRHVTVDSSIVSPPSRSMSDDSSSLTSPRKTRGIWKAQVIQQHESSDFVENFYDVGPELGRGGFGFVKLAVERNTQKERVCKFVNTEGLEPKILAMMKTEVKLLCQMDHPCVVRIFEYAFDQTRMEVVFVMEHLRGGDCCGLLEKAAAAKTRLGEPLVATLARQALLALAYCHSREVVHRDVKPENLMLADPIGLEATAADCKLIDFGLSLTREAPMHGNLYGTAPYMAPEKAILAMSKKKSEVEDFMPQADVWSCGITAFELLLDESPFNNPIKKATFNDLSKYSGYRYFEKKFIHLPIWRQRSADSHDFLKTLLIADPEKRPSAEQAATHPWIEMNERRRSSLGMEMVSSLTMYQHAPPVVRCCLYVIAARLGVSDLTRFGATFMRLDKDGNGSISPTELSEGLKELEGGDSVDVDFILNTADLSHSGSISFTEFLAACLYTRYASEGSLEPLMKRAFEALDDDRDGLITSAQVCALFRERDAATLKWLPQDRSFGVEEWVDCLQVARRTRVSTKELLLEDPLSPPQTICGEPAVDLSRIDFSRINLSTRRNPST